ncbi:MAG: aminotransferase class V-fold PLP-dependent enzyme [Anaerolineae bacterium]
MNSLKQYFLLDPTVTFLNHGSFGACPIPVFETYQNWQRELERQPVEFLGRRADELLAEARAKLGMYLNANLEDLVFVPNATIGINTVVRSLQLNVDDEVLTTNQEYGALDNAWTFMCQKTGAHYIKQQMKLPVTNHDDFVDAFWTGVTPHTKVIYISHITSPTALIFPVKEICRRAKAAGILTVVDGAHVPGQLPLDLTDLDVDFYSGNLHKWLCAPKGTGFLYVRRELHHLVEPLVVSWGWTDDASFVTQNQWQGTRDISGFLSVPAAIEFQQKHNWDKVRADCHALASEARGRIAELTGVEPIAPDSTEWFSQMVMCPLPPCDVIELKRRLYDEHRIELPHITWNDGAAIRISFQGYNSADDLGRLLTALKALL